MIGAGGEGVMRRGAVGQCTRRLACCAASGTGNGGDQVYLGDLGVQGNWSADSDVVSSAGIDYQRWYHTDGAIQVSLLVQTGVAVI